MSINILDPRGAFFIASCMVGSKLMEKLTAVLNLSEASKRVGYALAGYAGTVAWVGSCLTRKLADHYFPSTSWYITQPVCLLTGVGTMTLSDWLREQDGGKRREEQDAFVFLLAWSFLITVAVDQVAKRCFHTVLNRETVLRWFS